MRRLVMSVLVLTLALVAALGGAAYGATAAEPPYDSTVECMSCHGAAAPGTYAKAEFTAPVNYDSCDACHWVTVGSSYGFAHEKILYVPNCSSCHSGGDAQALWAGTVSTPYGYFATETSLEAPAADVHRIHASISGPATNWGGYCTSCHGAVGCETCHSAPTSHDEHLATQLSNPAYAPVTRVTSVGVVSSRETVNLVNVVAVTESCTASACHPAATLTTNPAPTCASCHPVADQATHAVGHDATDSTVDGTACSACHSLALTTEHEKVSSSTAAAGCAACHPQPAAGTKPWSGTCVTAGCHTVTSTAPMHAEVTTKHAVSTSNEVCLECHSGTELGSIHVTAETDTGATGCFVCHTGVAGEPASSDCTVCHFTFEDHYDETAHLSSWTLVGCSGAACHTTRDLMGAHTEKDPTFTCDGCHADFNVALQIEQGLTGCGDCHTNIYQTSGHRSVHWPTPLLADATGPHYSYYTGSAGTAPTSDCVGCHTSNLVDEHMGMTDTETGFYIRMPRQDSTGANLTCDSCHSQPVGSTVQTAIANSSATCESCHQVHGPMQAVHASTFIDNPPVACADCHSSNLTVEHNGGYTSSAGLTGCDVCHALYTGEMAATVQGAIATANDTQCDACHASYHTNSAAHTATSAASLACADCHDTAATDSVDVTQIHAGASAGPCKVCHASTRIGAISDHSAECASCHATEGTDYHLTMGVHVAPASSGCQVSGCHHNKTDVREIHTCATCHADASDPGKTTACANCHATVGVDYHYDFDVDHTPVDTYSTDCAGCHETTDVRVLHETNSCNQCHYINGCTDCHSIHMGSLGLVRSTGCATCHNVEGASGNYHTAMDTSHTFGGMAEGCKTCHEQTLPAEHEKYLSRYAEYTDSCALCHKNADETRIDWENASADCSSCHTVHGDIQEIHTPSASDACVRCHDDGDLRYLHGTSVDESCATCHNATFDLSGKTTECTSCHYDGGVPFHGDISTAHTYGTMGSDCQTSGCHVKTLPEEHAKYLSRYPAYADTCALCHLNADPARIPAGATAACSSCHDGHGDITTIHTATGSQECVACHETGLTLDIHKKTDGTTDCAMCHAAAAGRINWDTATIECTSCHGTLSPVDPNHYPVANHDASAESGCGQCHYKDMKLEHFKTTVAVTCVQCHEVKVDSFTTAWDKTCVACHPTKHGDQRTKHVSTTTSCGTAATGCHNIADAESIHTQAGGPGCGACHKDPATPATTTNCTDAACHANVGTNHKALHDAAAVNPSGCKGCHFMNLVDEHAALGLTCGTCHDNATYASVIAANDLRCKSCHPTMHSKQDYEFNPKMAGGHRVSAELPGMQSSFVVNGATYTMGIPSAASFLKSGWTTSSIVPCDSCHTYSGATGPHGATMTVNIDPAYSTNWKTAYLRSGTTLGMSSNTIICAKCHDLNGTGSSFSNNVHGDGDHQDSSDGQCAKCHVQVPHGWGRPRLLGSVADAAPYGTLATGLDKFTLKSYTPNSWSDSNCFAACTGDHDSPIGTAWPNAYTAPAATTGNVSGTVKNAAGAAISGATVSVGGKTATTSSTGAYSITGIVTGTYTMNVTATGYNAWSGSVTIASNTTATQNVTLTAVVVTQYGNVSGTVKNASGAAISGATVSVGGKTATTSSTGAYSITGIVTGTYTMNVSATGYNAWSGSVTIASNTTATQNVTLTAVAPTTTNLARTGTATASSVSGWSYTASKAIDGRTDTYWRSNGGSTEWLSVDLAAAKTIDKVVVNWYSSDYARVYRVETSTDGRTWTSRYSTSSGNGGVDTLTFAPVSARYVRVYCTDSYSSDYRILEFEVWGY